MQGRHNGHVGSEVAVVPDVHIGIILHGQIEIAEKALADVGVLAVMKRDGPLKKAPLAQVAQYLRQNGGALFHFILIGRVVVKIQIMRAALDFLQLRVAGKEQDAGAALFIFCHGMFPFRSMDSACFPRGFRAGVHRTISNVPAPIRMQPISECTVNFSCRKTKASTSVMTTLSLSTGTTREASPICNA